MKKFYLHAACLSLILTLLAGCQKDELPTINAPALPAKELQWGMSQANLDKVMNNAGYSMIKMNYYMHKSDFSAFWKVEVTSGLSSLTYYYCGGNTEWARNFWANLAGFGDQYRIGLITWKRVTSKPITTSNTTITLDTAPSQRLQIGKLDYTSTMSATYVRKGSK